MRITPTHPSNMCSIHGIQLTPLLPTMQPVSPGNSDHRSGTTVNGKTRSAHQITLVSRPGCALILDPERLDQTLQDSKQWSSAVSIEG